MCRSTVSDCEYILNHNLKNGGIDGGNDLLPDSTNPSPPPTLVKIYDVIWRHEDTNEFAQFPRMLWIQTISWADME